MKPAALLLLVLLPSPVAFPEEKPLPKELPPFGEERPLPALSLQESTLPNGLTVWLLPRPGFPKVTAIVTVRGGTAADAPGFEGTSEVLAEALKAGTAKRSSRKIAEELEAVGGELSSSAGDDALTLSVDGLSDGASELLEILGDVSENASFPPSEVELAKTNALEGLKVRSAEPSFAADKAFASAVYGNHPYRTVAPTPRAIEAVTPLLLKGVYSSRFRPQGALLVVAGAFEAAALLKAIEGAFGPWKARGLPPPKTLPVPATKPHATLLVDRPGSVQSVLLVGRSTLSPQDPRRYALSVANTIFGGAFGSRLVKNLREDKGYTYTPSSSASTEEQGGILEVRSDVRTEVTAPALLETFYELDRMAAQRVSDEELQKAKRYTSGLFLLRNQLQGSVAAALSANWVKGLPPQALTEFVSRINAATPDEVLAASRAFFPSRSQVVVVVGDAKKIRDDLLLFGPVTLVTP